MPPLEDPGTWHGYNESDAAEMLLPAKTQTEVTQICPRLDRRATAPPDTVDLAINNTIRRKSDSETGQQPDQGNVSSPPTVNMNGHTTKRRRASSNNNEARRQSDKTLAPSPGRVRECMSSVYRNNPGGKLDERRSKCRNSHNRHNPRKPPTGINTTSHKQQHRRRHPWKRCNQSAGSRTKPVKRKQPSTHAHRVYPEREKCNQKNPMTQQGNRPNQDIRIGRRGQA